MSRLYEENFPKAVTEDLERKVNLRKHYPQKLSNVELATFWFGLDGSRPGTAAEARRRLTENVCHRRAGALP